MIESWWPSDENSRDSIHQKHGIGSSFDQKKKHGIGKVESKETQPMNHPSSSFSGPMVVISIYFTD